MKHALVPFEPAIWLVLGGVCARGPVRAVLCARASLWHCAGLGAGRRLECASAGGCAESPCHTFKTRLQRVSRRLLCRLCADPIDRLVGAGGGARLAVAS